MSSDQNLGEMCSTYIGDCIIQLYVTVGNISFQP